VGRAPGKTRAQRKHEREQRALLRLRKAAVAYTTASDGDTSDDGPDDTNRLAFAFAELTASCDRYTNTLNARERRKLARSGRA